MRQTHLALLDAAARSARLRVRVSACIGVWISACVSACVSAGPPAPDIETLDEAGYRGALQQQFQYKPPAPGPAEINDRRAGQIADAAYFEAFPDFDHAYTRRTRAEARRRAVQLRNVAGGLSHEQFVLRVAEIAALADNGHTSIGFNAFKKNTPRIPLRTYWFPDGLYVLMASTTQDDLIGARVDAIDDTPVEAIYAGLRRYVGGEDAWRRLQVTALFESPAMLQAAGLARSGDALTLSGIGADGVAFTRRVVAEQRDRGAPIFPAAQQMLFPQPASRQPPSPDPGAMRSLLARDGSAPLWLSAPGKLFQIDAAPREGLYVRLSHNNDADEGPIAAVLDAVMARITTQHPAYLVVDMRMNGGGDYTTTYAFARALPEAMNGGHIYILTSGWTFSAAITTTAALKQAGGARVSIVGEPVGDRLDFWAEGDQFELPNSFLTVSYASGRHNYAGPCTDRRSCFWLNEKYPVRVRTLAPDLLAPLTFQAYAAGRDPAMEAVAHAEALRRP